MIPITEAPSPSPINVNAKERTPNAISAIFQKIYPMLPPKAFPEPGTMSSIIQSAAEQGISRVVLQNPAPSPDGLLLQTIDPDGIYTCTSLDPFSKLGEGASATIFEGTRLQIGPEHDVQLDLVAIAKIAREKFDATPFNLLESVPPSPSLLGRPIEFFGNKSTCDNVLIRGARSPHSLYRQKESANYVYMTMPPLEGSDLFDTLACMEPDDPRKFKLLIEGCATTAEAIFLLHTHDYIHSDVRLENMSPAGVFDYGALRKEGTLGPWKGANWESCPPEIILTVNPPGSDDLIRRFYTWYGEEEVRALHESLPPPKNNERGEPLCSYTKAVDVYLLGMQIIDFYGGEHPKFWTFDTTPLMEELKNYVTRMVSLEAAIRPPMEECALFFQSFAERLA